MSLRLFAAVFTVVFAAILALTAGLVAVRIALVDRGALVERAQQAVGAALGRDVAVVEPGMIRFRPRRGPALTLTAVRVPAGGGYEQPLAVARDVQVRFAWADILLGRQATPRRVTVGELSAYLAWDGRGRTSWQQRRSRPSEPGTLGPGTVVRVNEGTIRLAPPTGGERRFTLRQGRFQGRLPGLTGQRLWRLEARLARGDASPWQVKLGLERLGQVLAGASGRLELRLRQGGTSFAVYGEAGGLANGAAGLSFDGEVSAAGANLAQRWPFARPPADAVPAVPFRLSAQLASQADGLRFRNLALRAGGARAIGRGQLQTRRAAGPAKLSGQLFVDHFDLAALAGRWRGFWQALGQAGPALALDVEAGALWAGPLKAAGKSQLRVVQRGGEPLTVTARSRVPQRLLPASRARPRATRSGPPRPKRPASAGTVALAWERALRAPQNKLADPDCLAGRLRFRAGTAFLHAVLDSRDGRRIVAGQARAGGPDLTVKQRRAGRRQAWHIGGAWDAPRLIRVPQPDSGPAGGLRVPAGGDCTGALAELAPGGD